jgi:hypothetical protein
MAVLPRCSAKVDSPVAHHEVVVRRRDADRGVADTFAVDRVCHVHLRPAGEDLGQPTRRRGWDVDDDKHRRAHLIRERVGQPRQCLDASGGSADRDQFGHATL